MTRGRSFGKRYHSPFVSFIYPTASDQYDNVTNFHQRHVHRDVTGITGIASSPVFTRHLEAKGRIGEQCTELPIGGVG